MYVNTKYNTTICTCIITYLPTPGKTLQHKRGWLGLLVDFLSLIKKKDIVTINKIYNYILLRSPSLGKIIHVHVHKTFKMNFKFEYFYYKKKNPTQLKEKPLDSMNIHYPRFIKISPVNAINMWHNRSCKEQIFFLNMKFKQHYLWH